MASEVASLRSTPRPAPRSGGSIRSRAQASSVATPGHRRAIPTQSGRRPGLHGGASIWQAVAIDPDLGMLYFSTGNAGPDGDGSVRPGDNLFSASIVALDYGTGQYKWHFQEAHHDIWDFDVPSPTAFDQTYSGVSRKGIYESGKTGWLYFLDRTNGQPLIGIEEKPVEQEPRQATAATQPYPVGDAFIDQCADPLPSFPLSKCIFGTYWDAPRTVQAVRWRRHGMEPEHVRPADRFRLHIRGGAGQWRRGTATAIHAR